MLESTTEQALHSNETQMEQIGILGGKSNNTNEHRNHEFHDPKSRPVLSEFSSSRIRWSRKGSKKYLPNTRSNPCSIRSKGSTQACLGSNPWRLLHHGYAWPSVQRVAGG
ncbi:uncharacterized protein FOMMEDRAFT_23917 [Fomitiporia mediterranea MF3/22]|uniref:uncharacterized protein n=1 Tax=Fomitiporia mediterranea (strain MF3/22) TaxID=694068 RepID=UPI0004409B08|nr:uncharacterized protein FOMMEDRAFT_23917 [Fomitiporia mediterranea MF3/22]EJC97849.1 hypothetical protein FOMMEDRAFT_23917 [Fomitiporia mediterranea MF3/22]